MEGAYLTNGKFPCYISFFIYTFFRLSSFSQILNMKFKTFTTYSLVITSRHNYSNVVYFGNYQRISVSIETSAKCRYFTVMRLRADTLFFKTKFIYSRGILSSFTLCCFCFPKLSSMVCRNNKGQTCIQEN